MAEDNLPKNDNKVEIQYTNPILLSRFGSKPIRVNPSMAKDYENRGLARILTSLPQVNPTLSKEEIEEIEGKYHNDKVAYMPEQENLTKIVWVSGGYLDRQTVAAGENFGFDVTTVYPGTFSPGRLLLGDLLILNSDLRGYTGAQMQQIKATLFQKGKPYILRIMGTTYDINWMRQLILHTKFVIFSDEEVFNYAVELYDEMIESWLIEDASGSPVEQFWTTINGVIEEIY